jgi:hypothetical protein
LNDGSFTFTSLLFAVTGGDSGTEGIIVFFGSIQWFSGGSFDFLVECTDSVDSKSFQRTVGHKERELTDG